MVAISGKHNAKQRQSFRLSRACLVAIMVAVTSTSMWILRMQTSVVYEETIEPLLSLHHDDMTHPRFRFLEYYDLLHPPNSDIAELRHCNLSNMDWKDYFTWASHILDEKMPQFRSNQEFANFTDWQGMEEEFVLELLEMYATFHDMCHFDTGYPFVPTRLTPASQVFAHVPLEYVGARLAIVISAFQDAPQLQRLVQAIYMPHYYIVIHVERRTSPQYLKEVQEVASRYDNVAIVQFGTIIYRTDMITSLQLQLIKWLSSSLTYDYHITLNGAAYPLYSAQELAIHFQNSKRHVWLGELTNGRDGTRVRTSQAGMLIGAKRLAYTRGNETKGTFRLSQSLVEQDGAFDMSTVGDDLHDAMSRKTVSGNQAVYSYETIQQLLSSPSAMKLFALAKYGCCGVLEERTWIAALRLIDKGDEALEEPGCMWQVWGGAETCQSSVNNAILTRNASFCFKVEDGTRGMERNESALYIRGNQMMEYLKDAKKRGFLFARKFQSDNSASMALLEDIRNEIHNS